jgi:DNA methylase
MKKTTRPLKAKPKKGTPKGKVTRLEPVAPKKQEVTVAAAKGRPMLTWVGKRPLRRVTVFPAQLVETFNPLNQKAGWQNLLFHGDNKDVLTWLLANGYRGKVTLVYIDPPFDSGADYVRKVQLRGVAGTTKIDGETYALGEQIQYTDIWVNDNYLQFMYERMLLIKELLTHRGFLFLHCNLDRCHYLKCLADEIFGPGGFRNQIAWKRTAAHGDTHGVGNVYDMILAYSPDPDAVLATLHVPYDPEYISSHYTQVDQDGRRFQLVDLTAPGPRPGLAYEFHGVWPPPGRVWTMLPEKMEALFAEGRVVFTAEGKPRKKQYLDKMPGMPIHDVWVDVFPINSQAIEALGYPTQKPSALLDRILKLGSKPGDLVLDCFIGSGTTATVAQKLGRRWVGCDINKGAIQTTAERLQTLIREQIEAERQAMLPGSEGSDQGKPASLCFSVYRVNDYDLAIQHNEAVNLACEHLGVQRTRTDAYFDGTLGKRLVKIIPFGHPLTPLDLQELEKELKARPKEDRDLVVVCLGKEFSTDTWLEDWNRHRPVNKIEAIELRTDKRYGKFFTHQPSRARVEIRRVKDKLVVTIKDFISPTVIERLNMDQSLFKAQITDWRAMVDSVIIDTAYDGKVFNVALSDVPERKIDLVAGRYELPAPGGPATVAVKITDMLGAEVLVTAEV